MPKKPYIVALLLAAGRSTRFGNENKLLAELDGLPVLARTIRLAKESGAGRVLVVTGHDRRAVEAVAGAEGVATTHNPDYLDGMGSSIAAGVRSSLAPDADDRPAPAGWLVWPGDMPCLQPGTARSVVDSFDPARPVVPTFNGQRGHPVLFPASFGERLARLTGDSGARTLLAEAAVIEIGDPGILRDIDTRADLAAPFGQDI